VEAEGVSDRKRGHPDFEGLGSPEGQRTELVLRRIDPDHGEVLVSRDTDDRRAPRRVIGKRHDDPPRAGDDVEVRDDVALLVPHEAAPLALRDLLEVEAEEASADREIADEDDRRGGLLEDGDEPPLLLAELE